MIRKALSLGIRAEVLMLTFSIGAVAGMLFEAVAITLPKVTLAIMGAVL